MAVRRVRPPPRAPSVLRRSLTRVAHVRRVLGPPLRRPVANESANEVGGREQPCPIHVAQRLRLTPCGWRDAQPVRPVRRNPASSALRIPRLRKPRQPHPAGAASTCTAHSRPSCKSCPRRSAAPRARRSPSGISTAFGRSWCSCLRFHSSLGRRFSVSRKSVSCFSLLRTK